MNFPPRLGHLATRSVVVQKLAPLYASAHGIDFEEASLRLQAAMAGALWEQLLGETWKALVAGQKKLDEQGLLEKVASSLKDRPSRLGKEVPVTPGLSAFLVLADLAAGTASDAARKVLESPEGRKRGAAGMAEAGAFLAKELTRK